MQITVTHNFVCYVMMNSIDFTLKSDLMQILLHDQVTMFVDNTMNVFRRLCVRVQYRKLNSTPQLVTLTFVMCKNKLKIKILVE